MGSLSLMAHTCKHSVVKDVNGVASNKRAVNTLDRMLDPQVPNLYCVVPATAHEEVGVRRIEFEREDAIGMARGHLCKTDAIGARKREGGGGPYGARQ